MQNLESRAEVNHAQVSESAHEAGTTDIAATEDKRRSTATGIHPHVFTIGLGAVIWFLTMTWLDFAWNRHVDLDLVVVTGFCFFFFGLLLFTYSKVAKDPRWGRKEMSFADFLHSRVATYTGMRRGRDVLISITLIPLTLALGATLIGLTWVGVHLWQ
jgi:hypothetical protein